MGVDQEMDKSSGWVSWVRLTQGGVSCVVGLEAEVHDVCVTVHSLGDTSIDRPLELREA